MAKMMSPAQRKAVFAKSNHGKAVQPMGPKPTGNGPSPTRQAKEDQLIQSIMSQSAFKR